MGARKSDRYTARTRRVRGGAEERKSERVELRTTEDEKRLLVAAAVHERLDVTAFVLRAALPAAREIVDRASSIELSARDTARVLELIENPPEPTPRLRRAAESLRTNRAALGKQSATKSRGQRQQPDERAPARSPRRGSRRRG